MLVGVLIFMLSLSVIAVSENEDFPVLKGPYFGKKTPEGKAEVFMNGIISILNEDEMCAAFTPDGREFYFNARHRENWAIFLTEEVDGQWTRPKPLPFTSDYTDRDFTMSPDGTKIIFGSNRPRSESAGKSKSLDIFMTERLASGGWSDPRNIGDPVNTTRNENYPSMALNGNLYFFTHKEVGFGGCDIYVSNYVDGRYQPPENLGGAINSEQHDWDAIIAPDESFLIFSSKDRPDSVGMQDLYISYKKEDGGWTLAKNMGPAVNSSHDEICPSLSLDGRCLFFTSRRRGKADIFWIDARIIDDLKQVDFPVLKGPYLGQKPPGLTPKIFAPGIVSTGYSERNITVSPDGKELYYCLYGAPHGVFLFMREVNGLWIKPRIPSFSGRYQGELMLSPDGNMIVFSSNQPFENSKNTMEYWIWRVKREGADWGCPKPLGPAVNSGRFAGYPSISRTGNLYFFSERDDGLGKDDIYMSEWIDGRYTEAQNLGKSINTNLAEADPAIAPDESYIIFCRREGESGWDLFISFKKKDGSWSLAKNMGEPINSDASDFCPSLSADGKYLFFTSTRIRLPTYSEIPITYEEKIRFLRSPGNGNSDIYWVDAKILEIFRPDDWNSMQAR